MQDILTTAEADMKKALDYFTTDLEGVQAGRAQPSLIDGLKVDAYGQEMTMKQVGSISTPDAKTIQVQVWDAALVPAVEKAIRDAASLGLNPATDGSIVRMQVPVMTEERRTDLVKLIGEKQEACHIALRNARHDGLKAAKRGKDDGSLPEDEYFRTEKQLDELIRTNQSEAEKLHDAKKLELQTI